LFWDYLSTSLQRENLASDDGNDRRSKITSFAVSSKITNMIRPAKQRVNRDQHENLKKKLCTEVASPNDAGKDDILKECDYE